MADKKVVLYSTPTWPWCTRAKEYLSQKKVAFTEFNVAADRNAAKEMIEKTQQRAVPVIVIDDEDILVGFNPAKLDELLSKGEKK